MIASLTGILKSKSPTEILVEVHGIGYTVSIPLSTYEKLGDIGSSVSLLTHFHVREDVMQLFGFFTEEERRLFKLLISVSGIGPKIAQSILSGMNVEELKSHLVSGNVNALTAIPGVGRKTAERLIVELRDKVGKILMQNLNQFLPSEQSERYQCALKRFRHLHRLDTTSKLPRKPSGLS